MCDLEGQFHRALSLNKKKRSETLAPNDLVYVVFATKTTLERDRTPLFEVAVIIDLETELDLGKPGELRGPWAYVEGMPDGERVHLKFRTSYFKNLTDKQKQMLDAEKRNFHWLKRE